MQVLNRLLGVVLGILGAVLGVVLGVVAALVWLVGAVLCVTVILLPLGIPLLAVARRLLTGAVQFADPKALQDGQQDDTGPRTGTAYLMRRRRELVSREEAYQHAALEADRIHATLMRYAVDGKRRR